MGVLERPGRVLAQLQANFYLAAAGLQPQNLVNCFPNLERNRRTVVFGSDWPGNPGIRHYRDALRGRLLSDGTAAIAGSNVVYILKLEETPEHPAPMIAEELR